MKECQVSIFKPATQRIELVRDSPSNHAEHQNQQQTRYHCDECRQSFISKHLLADHKIIHQKLKPIEIEIMQIPAEEPEKNSATRNEDIGFQDKSEKISIDRSILNHKQQGSKLACDEC